MNHIQEPARDLPVAGDVDVAVCGGGPAGVAAALAAARAGARTLLVERHGCLGGIWTSGLLAIFHDHENKDGIMAELLATIDARGGRGKVGDTPGNLCDVEVLKVLLEDLCLEAGVDLLYHSMVAGAAGDGPRLTHAIVESKSGREAIAAGCFIDCTGDGDLAARAGCGFDLGEPASGRTQPMSMIALVTGLDADAATAAGFLRTADRATWGSAKTNLHAAIESTGQTPSYAGTTLRWLGDELYIMMANHEYGVAATDAQAVTAATIHGRHEVHEIVNGLRSLGGLWSRLRVVATAEQIGTREARRIHGRATVTAADLEQGTQPDHGVGPATFPVDVHALSGESGKGLEPLPFNVKPYRIPLGALIAKDRDGLLMAGRCISGDHLAHGSYRVTGNAVAMGEAAGRVAAIAAQTGKLPHEIPVEEIVDCTMGIAAPGAHELGFS